MRPRGLLISGPVPISLQGERKNQQLVHVQVTACSIDGLEVRVRPLLLVELRAEVRPFLLRERSALREIAPRGCVFQSGSRQR